MVTSFKHPFIRLKAATVLLAFYTVICCQTNPPDNPSSENVSFCFRLPGKEETKAISDGLSATELRLYAYDANGTYLPALSIVREDAFAGREATATLSLVKGMTYCFVFVAVNPAAADNAYVFDPAAKTLTVDYSVLTANNDAYDCFTASLLNFTVTGPFTQDVTLKRPFSQVNVGVPVADYMVASNSGIKVDEIRSSLTFSDAGTEYDLMGNKVLSNAADSVLVPAKLRPVSENLTVGTDTYKYMAMAYILVPMDGVNDDNRALLGNVHLVLDVETAGGATSTLHRNVANVPVQKNWRTNLLGNIFGIQGGFHIYIDQRFTGDLPEDHPTGDHLSAGPNEAMEWDWGKGDAPGGTENFTTEGGEW